jgi:hypothetical protein
MIKRVAREEAQVVPLPGRDWHTYIWPHDTPTESERPEPLELVCFSSPPVAPGSCEMGDRS